MSSSTAAEILVIGGTGVSGVPLVSGLVERGYKVTVFHSGVHKPAQTDAPWYFDGSIKIVKGNAFKGSDLKDALLQHFAANGQEKVSYDIVCSMYGNLASIAQLFAKDPSFECKKFFSIGGVPIYDVYGISGRRIMNHVVDENYPIVTTTGDLTGKPNCHNPKIDRMVIAEQVVFKFHPTATHFRYPLMYGPYQIIPDEYYLVKRLMDGRKSVILPEGFGATPRNVCSGVNAAEGMLLATDAFWKAYLGKSVDPTAGEIFLACEDDNPTFEQWISICCKALGKPQMEIHALPFEIAKPSLPLVKDGFIRPVYMMSNEKMKRVLGYKDKIPVEECISVAVRSLKQDLENKRVDEKRLLFLLQDPFEYETEDKLIELWQQRDYNGCLKIEFKNEPGYGFFYYGNLRNPADQMTQEERHKGEYSHTEKVRVNKSSKL